LSSIIKGAVKMNTNEILSGKDDTEGIVSVYANKKGKVTIWRRVSNIVSVETGPFWNWFLLAENSLLDGVSEQMYQLKELEGNHPLRWAVCTKQYADVEKAVVFNYNARHKTKHRSFYDLPNGVVLHFPAIEQYLIASGRTYFWGMGWDDLHRLQFDLETYALDPIDGGIFLIAIRDNQGYERILDDTEMSEADMILELVNIIRERDPDIIENHNIFAFDLPFLERRAEMYDIPLSLGRDGTKITSFRGTLKVGESSERFTRYSIRGREIIDTLHAVKRWNAIMRELRSEGLKEVAQYFGIAEADREYIDGDKLPQVWKEAPNRVRRYALDDVREVAALSDMLMRDKFILVQMLPMSFEKVATAGTASCLNSLMVRAYLSQSHSLPQSKPKVKFKGGETQLIAEGVVQNVLHADVSSMYPSIMLNYNVKPENDNLDVFLTILRELTNIRLEAKAHLKTLEKGTPEYNNINALQSAMKILINSAFGYMGATFTVFNDPTQAGEVTRYGRQILTEMLAAIREFGGQPIEADTDGIYLALPENAEALELLKTINEKVGREGIKIDGDEYAGMYCKAKKHYALLTDDGKIIVKGGGLKSRDTELYLTEFISTGLECLLRYDVEGLRNAWEHAVNKIRNGSVSVEKISKITKLGKAVAEYIGKDKAIPPQYRAPIAAGKTDLKAGERVEYYKSQNGWKLSSEFEKDYDKQHYLRRMKTMAKRFDKAFTSTDYRTLFSLEADLFDNATQVIRPQFRIVENEKKEWIELAHGIKRNKDDPFYRVDRHNWIEIDDKATIDDFREKHGNVDVYRSQLAVIAEQEPSDNLAQYQRTGDFWMEFEGSKEDTNKMLQALKAAHLSDDIVANLFDCSRFIRYRYNGGRSLYLIIPMSVFEKEAVINLHLKYQKVAEKIVAELPEQLRKRVDMELYTASKFSRLEGSIYPDGGYDVAIPTELILTENWDAIVALSKDEPVERTENTVEQKPEIPELYRELTKDVPDTPPKKGNRGRRNLKRKQALKKWRLHFNDVQIPCVSALIDAVIVGESIGFEGRNKLIWELYNTGVDDNTICELFIENGNPSRYGVLEEDTSPDANACGYHLRDSFNPFDNEFNFDPSCKHFPHLCDPMKCYRAEEYRANEKFEQISFNEFRQRARNGLGGVMSQDENITVGIITVVDASLSSGKTYLIAWKGKELSAKGHTTMALAPTHDACSKIIAELRDKHGGVAEYVIAVHIFGRREDTCISEMFKKGTGCSSCKYNKKFYDDEEGEKLRREIQQECCGCIIDLPELQELAEKYETCVSAISKVLARPDVDGITVFAVMPHAYLTNRQNRGLIEGINPNYVFVDEADMLIDTMLGQYQRSLMVAGSRSRKDRLYSDPCAHTCDRCHVHFSDAFTDRIRPRSKLASPESYGEVAKPEHFIDYLGESVNDVERMIRSGNVQDIFNFEAVRRNIDRIGEILSVIPYEGQCPYEYFTALQEKLIEAEGVEVDCLYEGLSYWDTGQGKEKVIRPAVYVTKIEVECILTEDGLMKLSFPELMGDQEIRPDEDTILEPGNTTTADVYTSKMVAAQYKETESERSLRAFLEFANFVENAPKKGDKSSVEMYFEIPHKCDEPVNDEESEPHKMSQRTGVKYCAIRLRYLDAEGYRSAIKFLQKRKTMMLSGTFLDKERLAETLLVQSDDVNYIDARVPMHDSSLIIHHNPHMGKLISGVTGISLSQFGDPNVLELYNRVAQMRENTSGTKILHYGINTRQGNITYNAVEKNQHLNGRFYVQNECNKKTQIPDWCSPEGNSERKPDWLFFDKVRSSTSRAVDREEFHLLTVHGNCYPDWYDMMPLVSAIRECVNPQVDLERVIEYNRQRAVFQTLLRNQRNEQRHVSIYLSGDMHYTDYPDYLRNRVLETNALMRKLKEMYPDDFLSNRQVQIEMIARVVVAFLEGSLSDIDALLRAEVTAPDNPPEILAAVFGGFEFVGDYGKGETARKVVVDLSNIPDDERYLIESFVDEHRGNTDHARAYQTAIERLEHIKECVADKGYVDRVKDKKGERTAWQKWVEHLVDKKYLEAFEIEVEGKRGKRSKTGYKIAENTVVD